MAFEVKITAFKHAPWGGVTGIGDIVVWNVDWSAGTYLWQFGYPETLAEVISLENAASGSQGVFASYDANYVDPVTLAQGAATLIRPQIDEATLEGLTYSGVADLPMKHTLYGTIAGVRRVICFGPVAIKQGVADA